MSSIDSLLNPVLLVIITLLVSLCVIGSGGMLAWLGNPSIRDAWYLPRRQENFMINLGIYFLLLSSFVSVTLISSVLVVKNIQSYFMENSLQMYHEETDTPMKVRTFTLIRSMLSTSPKTSPTWIVSPTEKAPSPSGFTQR